MIAYHEAGHTVAGLVLSDARIVHKVTIVPRGNAGGYAIMLPREDRYLMTEKDMTEQIVGLLGGRVAEEVFFGSQSSGASNDFQQATQLARSMVTEYGMSPKLGPVQYEQNNQVFLGRDYGSSKAYSEQIAFEIDSEVLRIMNEGHERATEIIKAHGPQMKLIAEHLLEYETLNEIEIKSLFEDGVMPSRGDDKTEYPREITEEEVDQAGTSYDEIKRAHEERVKEMERLFEEQKEGRRTLGTTDIEQSEMEEKDPLVPETKTEIKPEDVDVDQLQEESSEENITEDKEDDNHESN
jgi:cell division protease FtsH